LVQRVRLFEVLVRFLLLAQEDGRQTDDFNPGFCDYANAHLVQCWQVLEVEVSADKADFLASHPEVFPKLLRRVNPFARNRLSVSRHGSAGFQVNFLTLAETELFRHFALIVCLLVGLSVSWATKHRTFLPEFRFRLTIMHVHKCV